MSAGTIPARVAAARSSRSAACTECLSQPSSPRRRGPHRRHTRVRQRFVEQGLSAALLPKPSERFYTRKPDGEREAHLLALACGRPPEGEARWTLRLLAERVVALEHVATLSHETVRQTLKKTS